MDYVRIVLQPPYALVDMAEECSRLEECSCVVLVGELVLYY
jgi:hypothetical protein